AGEFLHRFGDAGMFERTGDDGRGGFANEAENCEVVGFGGAAGEQDFFGFSVEAAGAALTSGVERLPGGAAEGMAAGGIAGLERPGTHRLPGFLQKRGAGGT